MGSGASTTARRGQSQICTDIPIHVHNANAFLSKMRRIVDGIDITPFDGLNAQELIETLPMGESKEASMILIVYILLSRSESKMAELMISLIDSELGILEKLSMMIETDKWPRSFSGHNQLQFVARKENDFLHAYISSITSNPSMRLVSSKISSPFVSIFNVIKKVVETTG